MITLRFTTNQTDRSLVHLKTYLRSSKETKFAVAYVKIRGLKLIEHELEESLRRGNRINILVGLGFGTTDKESLVELERLQYMYRSLQCRVFASKDYDFSEFHPKLYYFRSGNSSHLLIGSSNLTLGGLSSNLEAMACLEGRSDSLFMKEVTSYFDFLWQHGKTLTGPIISAYEPMAQHRRAFERRSKFTWRRIKGDLNKAEHDVRNVRSLARILIPLNLSYSEPKSTPQIYDLVRRKIPQLCRDQPRCETNPRRPEWHHQVRWALLDLKHAKQIVHTGYNRYVLFPGQNYGAYRKELNCGRGKHHYVVPRSGKSTYLICTKCRSHKTITRS